jgi:hypothetical protein
MYNEANREWRFYLTDMISFAEKVILYTDDLDLPSSTTRFTGTFACTKLNKNLRFWSLYFYLCNFKLTLVMCKFFIASTTNSILPKLTLSPTTGWRYLL